MSKHAGFCRRPAAARAGRAEAQVEQEEEAVKIEPKSIKALTLLSLKRTFDLFVGNYSQKVPLDEGAQKAKLACKVGGWVDSPGQAGAWSGELVAGLLCEEATRAPCKVGSCAVLGVLGCGPGCGPGLHARRSRAGCLRMGGGDLGLRKC